MARGTALGSGISSNNTSSSNNTADEIELQQASQFEYHHKSSNDSAVSSIFDNLNEMSEQQLQRERAELGLDNDNDAEAADEEAAGLLTNQLGYIKKSYAARKKCLLVFLVVFLMWVIALISYSQGTKVSQNNDNINNKSGAAISSTKSISATNTATVAVPTQTPTKTKTPNKSAKNKRISLDDYRMGNFYVFNKEIDFFGTDNYISKTSTNFVLKGLSDPNGKDSVLFQDGTKFTYQGKEHNVKAVAMNPTQDKILVISASTAQWRHSSFSYYWMYDVASASFEPLHEEGAAISYACWSPTGKYISYVLQYDLYIFDVSNKETRRLTEDGGPETIYNGKPDWVYEEEVLSTDHSIWWSPNDSNVMFMKLDITDVPVYPLEFFVQQKDEKYPELQNLKYPKPGYPNPKPTLVNYNVETQMLTDLPKSEFGDEFILYFAKFITDNEIIVKESDRESNIMNVNLYNTTSGVYNKIRSYKAESYGGWIEKPGELVIVERDGHLGYIDTEVYEDYNHLAYFRHYTDAEPFKMLTSGNFDIADKFHYNKEKDEVYVLSTLESDPLSHHLFKIEMSNNNNDQQFKMSAMTEIKHRGYYDINFNDDASYAVLNYLGPQLPYQKIVNLPEFSLSSYKKADMLNNNAIARLSQQRFDIPTTHYSNITIDGIDFEYIEIRPADFDQSREKEYPLLVNIYGGPGSVKLSNSYGVGFEHVVSSSLDAIVIYLDPRGTGGKGWKFKKWATRNIGHWEPRDITAITKQLISDKQYIDSSRTAIWGWSYGGFTTLKTLEYDQGDVFKYGMAVAPVTDWTFYDSIYTERFMDTPENNPQGYKESKINGIAGFKKVSRFLIMHGTGDDNVHLQNTLKLLDEFDINGVENYDMHVFPDSNHSIYFNNANTIVYDKLFNWLKKAFAGKYS